MVGFWVSLLFVCMSMAKKRGVVKGTVFEVCVGVVKAKAAEGKRIGLYAAITKLHCMHSIMTTNVLNEEADLPI